MNLVRCLHRLCLTLKASYTRRENHTSRDKSILVLVDKKFVYFTPLFRAYVVQPLQRTIKHRRFGSCSRWTFIQRQARPRGCPFVYTFLYSTYPCNFAQSDSKLKYPTYTIKNKINQIWKMKVDWRNQNKRQIHGYHPSSEQPMPAEEARKAS